MSVHSAGYSLLTKHICYDLARFFALVNAPSGKSLLPFVLMAVTPAFLRRKSQTYQCRSDFFSALVSSAFGAFLFQRCVKLSAPLFPSARFPVWVTVWVKQFLAVIRCLSEEADPFLYHFGTPRFNNAHDVP